MRPVGTGGRQVDDHGDAPASPRTGPVVSSDLDAIRGVAALAVLVYHVRYRFFLDYGDALVRGPLASAFYVLTSFGHDAVMVFFVLSGYLISSSVFRDRRRGTWSWKVYSLNRLTRLYAVLVPGLALTLAWDGLGLALHGPHPIYTGAARPWYHDFFPVAARLGWEDLAANALFLQTIVAPPLGSNEPLWSLSYEFWYYVALPLGLAALSGGWAKRAADVTGACAIAWLVGGAIRAYFPVWLLGTALCLLPRVGALQRPWHPLARLSVVAVFMAAVVATHVPQLRVLVGGSQLAADYVTGVSFAVCLWLLLHNAAHATSSWYTRSAAVLAGCSYTLYVAHMPVLVFLRATFVPDRPWEPEPAAFALAVVLSLAVFGYAWALARATEARTDLLKRAIAARWPAVAGRSAPGAR